MNPFSLLFSFFGKPSGFGSAGICRQRECGALTIIGAGLTGLQIGVETAITGISVRRFVCRYYLEVNAKLPNEKSETKGRIVSDKWSRDIEVEGEVTGSTGLMAATMATDITSTLANDVTTFAPTAGLIFLDEVTETQERGAESFRSISARASSNPQLTALS